MSQPKGGVREPMALQRDDRADQHRIDPRGVDQRHEDRGQDQHHHDRIDEHATDEEGHRDREQDGVGAGLVGADRRNQLRNLGEESATRSGPGADQDERCR